MVERYTPARGDIVWLTFDPQAGREQTKRRPAIVLSPASYNEKVGQALFCPVTSKVKGYPFEVVLPASIPIRGVILADQVKSLDWRARDTRFACRTSLRVVSEVLEKLQTLLGLNSDP